MTVIDYLRILASTETETEKKTPSGDGCLVRQWGFCDNFSSHQPQDREIYRDWRDQWLSCIYYILIPGQLGCNGNVMSQYTSVQQVSSQNLIEF